MALNQKKSELGVSASISKKKGDKMKKTVCWKFFFWGIFLLGVLCRIQNAYFHFTHYDDIGVAVSYFYYGNLGFIEKAGWTYAPLQLIFTTLLLSPEYSYNMNIFLGRFPSLICGVGSIYATYHLSRKVTQGNRNSEWISLFSMALMAFSWQNIIYSAQMEPYEIGVLFVTVIMLIFYWQFDESKKRNFLILSIVLGILCYGQYQLFIFVFSFYITCFIEKLMSKDYKAFTKYLVSSIGSFLITIPILAGMVSRGLLDRSTNWNVGPNNCFLFSLPSKDIIINIEYIIRFFGNNLYSLYKNFFVSNRSDVLSHVLIIFFIVLSILGFISLHRNRKYFKLRIFMDVNLILILGMIVLGKLTLSPSRHMMIVIPFLISYISMGLFCVLNFCKEKYTWIVPISILVVMICFFKGYFDEFNKRKMVLNEETIEIIVKEYNVDYICSYGYWFNLNLMKFTDYRNISEGQLPEISCFIKERQENTTRIIFIGGGPIDENSIDKCVDYIEKRTDIDLPDYCRWKMLYEESSPQKSATEYAVDFGEWGNGKSIYVYSWEE